MSVGKRLSKKRKELKLTQEDLAHKINVSKDGYFLMLTSTLIV